MARYGGGDKPKKTRSKSTGVRKHSMRPTYGGAREATERALSTSEANKPDTSRQLKAINSRLDKVNKALENSDLGKTQRDALKKKRKALTDARRTNFNIGANPNPTNKTEGVGLPKSRKGSYASPEHEAATKEFQKEMERLPGETNRNQKIYRSARGGSMRD